MFEEVDDADVEDDQADEVAKAELKFRELLAEIAKTQQVPAHHKANGTDYDGHWLPKGGGLLDIGALAGTLPIAPPVIFEATLCSGAWRPGGVTSAAPRRSASRTWRSKPGTGGGLEEGAT